MRAIDKLLEDLKKKSDEFDNKIRYVIHGKSTAKMEYRDLAYGTGMVQEDSQLVLLYNDKWNAIAEKVHMTSGRKIVFYEQCECIVHGPTHKFVIVHEPNEGNFSIPDDCIALYGHIHGRSFAKMNGFDLASDYHRYTPISIDDVEWFANAMKYWDKNVYSIKVTP